jgi:hypothetical protein
MGFDSGTGDNSHHIANERIESTLSGQTKEVGYPPVLLLSLHISLLPLHLPTVPFLHSNLAEIDCGGGTVGISSRPKPGSWTWQRQNRPLGTVTVPG